MVFRKKSTTSRRRPGGRGVDDAAQAKRPSVFSYRASRSNTSNNLGRSEAKEEVVRRQNPNAKSRLKRALRLVIFLAIAAVVVSNLLLTSNPKIVLVGATSTFRDASAYQAAAAQAFADSKFNSNKVTVNAGGIRQSLMQTFPELADVSVSLPLFGRQPVVYLQPSTSRLIVQTSSGAFILDDTGKAVASGSMVDTLRQAGLPEVHDETQLDIQLGTSVLPSTTVAFITEVVYQLKARGVVVDSLKLPNTPSELHLRIKDVGYYVKFNTRGDARVEVGSFLALKKYLESQNKIPAEYIDVRVESRAYYK